MVDIYKAGFFLNKLFVKITKIHKIYGINNFHANMSKKKPLSEKYKNMLIENLKGNNTYATDF